MDGGARRRGVDTVLWPRLGGRGLLTSVGTHGLQKTRLQNEVEAKVRRKLKEEEEAEAGKGNGSAVMSSAPTNAAASTASGKVPR